MRCKAYHKQDEVWGATKKEYVSCSLTGDVHVVISENAHKKIRYLLREFPDLEWACDLLGDIEPNRIIIKDIHIFEQEVSHAAVERIGEPHKDAIGVLHSHNTMGSFFSRTDIETADNWKISGVVNNKEEYQFIVEVNAPCGKPAQVKAKVIISNTVIPVDTTPIKEKTYKGLYEYYKGGLYGDSESF